MCAEYKWDFMLEASSIVGPFNFQINSGHSLFALVTRVNNGKTQTQKVYNLNPISNYYFRSRKKMLDLRVLPAVAR